MSRNMRNIERNTTQLQVPLKEIDNNTTPDDDPSKPSIFDMKVPYFTERGNRFLDERKFEIAIEWYTKPILSFL